MMDFRPQDFLQGVVDQTDHDEISKGIRKFKTKPKKTVPKQKKSCGSCIYCQESGSIYMCRHPRINEGVDPDFSCSRYIAARY